MSSFHFLIMAAVVWRAVRWKVSPRRPAARRGVADRPWLVALVSDAVIFGGLAYKESRRRAKAGRPTAVRDSRKKTWTRTWSTGDVGRPLGPPNRRTDDIPFP